MSDFLAFLKEPKPTNLDAPETTIHHREMVLRKRFLRKLYEDWYHSFLKRIPELPEGKILEIGSGGGFLKQLNHNIITSDVLPLPHCDLTFSAEKIPFDDNSISAIFLMDVLHHIPDCEQFFKEVERVLAKGGMLFMIEPANTWFSRFIFKNFHHEPFNAESKEWKFPSSGALSGANIALPWIVFSRDIDVFAQKYPSLKLDFIKLHTPFRYLITGGLSYKSIVPAWSFKMITFFEKILSPLQPFLAMFQTICVKKITNYEL